MKKLLSALSILILVSLMPLASYASPKLLVDEADLLTDEQEMTVLKELETVSADTGMDVAVLTVESIGDKSPMEYADDYFDYNGYGQGPDRSGVILLIAMESRDWYISTRGRAIDCLNDSQISEIGSGMNLSSGDYEGAFLFYAGDVKYDYELLLYTEEQNALNGGRGPFNPVPKIVISLIVGLIAGLIYRGVLKGQLKSVRANGGAMDYTRKDSFEVSEQRDIFLYSTTSKTAKPEPSSSSSSSSHTSTHTSSSGATHGGGGGKF